MKGITEASGSTAVAKVARVRLRPQGGNDYVVVVDRHPVATAHFARYRTGDGYRAEAWVERHGAEPTEMRTAYFADFVREIRRMFPQNDPRPGASGNPFP